MSGVTINMSRRRHSPQVLLLLETSRAYGRGLVEGIARYVEQHGPWSMFFEERGLNDPIPNWFKDWKGDGIISRTVRKADLRRLQSTGLPMIELYADSSLDIPCVYVDSGAITEMAVEHFLERGLRNMAFFCNDRNHWIDERRESFVTELERRGLVCAVFAASSERQKDWSQQVERREVTCWLRSLPKPCGIFCASDLYAARIMNICRSVGIAVPEQIAVLGVDNDPVLCSVCFPPLSSIDLGCPRIGYEAASMLDRLMSGKNCRKNKKFLMPERLVARQSTDVLNVDDPDLAKAIQYIRQHACMGLRVAEVATALGFSRRALEKQMQRFVQRTPKEEIMRLRMERARMLLQQTDMSVEQICRKSGFASFKYFARAFRREIGLTPREYRKRHRIL